MEFTDQAPSQYKNKTAFKYLGHSKIPTIRNVYGVRHGKGLCDACTGRVKQGITRLVKCGTEVVNSAVSFYDIAKKHLETDPVPFDKYQHFLQTFYFINKLPQRPITHTWTKVPDTRKLESVSNTNTPNLLNVRKIVYCCKPCIAGLGNCENTVYPDAWKCYDLQEKKFAGVILSNWVSDGICKIQPQIVGSNPDGSMIHSELSRCTFYICGTISIPLVNGTVKHSASQNTRSSNKDSAPLGSVSPPPTPMKTKGKEDKGKEDSKQTPVVFMKLLNSEQECKFIRPQAAKRDRHEGSSSNTLFSSKKGEQAEKPVEFDHQNTSVIYDCDVMVDDTSYWDWLIKQGITKPISTPKENDVTENITEKDQQKPTQPISTPKENDAEKPQLTPSMSSSKDVDKDIGLNMSDRILKIEQHLQHISSESQVD